MGGVSNEPISVVIVTMGNRPLDMQRCVDSVRSQRGVTVELVIVHNGCPAAQCGADAVVVLPENQGVPAARHHGIQAATGRLVFFLDDDAYLRDADVLARARLAFDDRRRLGAVSLRIVDPEGATSRRHVPRIGALGADRSGAVVTFLGGAAGIRRDAYDQCGGYWSELFYGHEELDLSWRLIDAGFEVHYCSDLVVVHPRTEIGRHREGWFLTGRNRVAIARRNLPWPVAIGHVLFWLVIGSIRAGSAWSSYLHGWYVGWSLPPIRRHPVSYATVIRLTRLGRPPIL